MHTVLIDQSFQCSINVNSPKLVYRFNAIPTNIFARYFIDTDNLILKYTKQGTFPEVAKIILRYKNKVEGITPPNSKAY